LERERLERERFEREMLQLSSPQLRVVFTDLNLTKKNTYMGWSSKGINFMEGDIS
jgi:hypothetical protein